jgi:sugar lactone lactonase YvrE
VDITAGLVHAWDPASARTETQAYRGEVSAAVPRATAASRVLSIGRQLTIVDESGTATVLANLDEEPEGNRLNDCRCDPQGRLWAGTMSKTRTPAVAALYRVDSSRAVRRVVSGTTISNGLGWSPSGETMYFIDSTTQRIDCFDFDGATGDIDGRRPFANVEASDGLPDGLAVDAEGGVWVCLFGGGRLRRYSPAGELELDLRLPVTNPTCPAFGGPRLETLFVTSARHRLSPGQLVAEPLAGALLALDPGVAGLPANRFAG